jgi:hypothetical protein
VSHSWNEPAYADIVDINSPHFYTADPDVSGAMHAAINAEWQKMPGKPLVFGETGNAVQNWSHASVQRIHDFITTALQNNVGIIFWNTSNAKDYLSESANVYLGPAERAEVARITAGLGPIATPTPTPRTINQPKAQPRRPPCWLKGCP